jgi:hypothetical protein
LIYLIATDTLRDMPALARQIGEYARSSSWETSDLVKPLTIIVLIGFPMLVRGYIFRRDRIEPDRKSSVTWFAVVWLLLEFVGVIMQGRMYAYHFLVLAPPAALLFGSIRRRLRVEAIAAALVPLAILSLAGTATVLKYRSHFEQRLVVSDYLTKHTSPGDAVWIDDAARLWLETGLRAGSRYPLTFLFANSNTAPLEFSNAMIEDFRRISPRYIVLRADLDGYIAHQSRYILEFARIEQRRRNFALAWKRIDDFVREHYVPEAQLGGQVFWRLGNAHE